MTDARTTVTLTHSIGMLGSPAFGAPVVSLLCAGDWLHAGAHSQGFFAVQNETGSAGYVPAAICTSQADLSAGGAPVSINVAQNVALLRSPTPGDHYGARWLVQPAERLQVLAEAGMFLKIQRPDGQLGYLPKVLCRISAVPPGKLAACQLVQTVALYSSPTPGGQFEAHWQIEPSEQLLELGRADQFVLVQRENGELGYVPAALCGQPIAEAILPAGPIDLGWIAIGGGWGVVNWAGLAWSLYGLALVDAALKPYLGLALVLGVAAAIWLGSRKRLLARSFAIGVLLAYAMLHFNSAGMFTLWR